jgi:hypothetical protein
MAVFNGFGRWLLASGSWSKTACQQRAAIDQQPVTYGLLSVNRLT